MILMYFDNLVAAAMSVKIDAMKLHLSKNHKDKSTKRKLEYWISKQRKMLQYLRRKVCVVIKYG
jgi:ribosomal protein S15P/S13E